MKLRLALRHEGDFWNAYIALANTMDGAKLIGSMLIGPAMKNPEIKQTFKDLMQQVMADGIEAMTGKAPEEFVTTPAPESERSGNA